MRKIFFILFLGVMGLQIHAQELICNVQVVSQQVQGSDKRVYETMQTAIWEFMNNRKWTNNVYKPEERIECSILINISERPSTDEFKGTIQVQSTRPVYKSSYNSPLFNYYDKDFYFKYLENQPIEFSENAILSSLTSVLGFYAYIIIGLDYDSYSLNGGTAYFEKAQNLVNMSQSVQDKEKGWKAFESQKNRYWLTENLMNQNYRAIRETYYKYHRTGMDFMYEKKEEARNNILESMLALQRLKREKPSLYFMQLFFTTKSDELVNVYSQATPQEKSRIVQVLSELDPTNVSKYTSIVNTR